MTVKAPSTHEAIVDASRHGVMPPSMEMSTPSRTVCSTSAKDAGAGKPWVFALVQASGQPSCRTRACTTGEADALSATVPSGACKYAGTVDRARTIRVSAPGQNAPGERASRRIDIMSVGVERGGVGDEPRHGLGKVSLLDLEYAPVARIRSGNLGTVDERGIRR